MSVKTNAEVKALRTRLEQARVSMESARAAALEAQRDYEEKRRKWEDMERRLKDLQRAQANAQVVVSEHALLRWLERVQGVDLDKVRAEMVSPKVHAAIEELGTCDIKTRDDVTLVVKDRTVVSVVTE